MVKKTREILVGLSAINATPFLPAGQTFKAHRLVLAACSTHFATIFNHTPVSAPLNNQFFVVLDGTRADDLQILLHFMYRGEAYLHQDRINSVLRTAEALQVLEKLLAANSISFLLSAKTADQWVIFFFSFLYRQVPNSGP